METLVRDAGKVLATLTTRNDASVVTSKGCKVYFPTRFADRFLAEVGVSNFCVGLFVIVVDNYYALVNVNAMVALNPSSTKTITFKDTEYFEMSFNAGAVVIESLELVQNNDILYRLYDELFSKGKIPWYVGYEDLANLYDTAKEFAGANVGENPEVIQLLTSLVSRNVNNRLQYYRSVVNTRKDLIDNPPAFVPLKSVMYSATNTVNKLVGSYFSEGVVSSLLYPTTRVEPLERILTA